ncbi:glycosyltransferase family 9 protein [Desulfonatronum thioautotrophicum]|uniref:glycosyltransferase family 9 protein n=1 Tax=Desulfonatronum thioautotrophicum TaxID=617001 RepID=UPI0005EBC7CF|nr:glycosyltransferase family 9 protein [Desulfonatronum thioautotrophicum]
MSAHLVIQLARFGDLIQTKRLVRGLQADPDHEVHLAVDTGLVPLATLLYPGVIVHGLPVHTSRAKPDSIVRACVTLVAALKAADITRVYNLNLSAYNHALAGLFAPEQVAGYQWNQGQLVRGLWPEMVFRLSVHRLTNPLNLMDYWGFFLDPPLVPNLVNPPATAKGGGLGVVLAGRHARRTLPVPIVARIIQATAARSTGRIHLLGTMAERGAARALRPLLPAAIQGRLNDLTGRTDWNGLAEVVQGLDLLLTPDTGTMHLAAHLGTPVMAFFLSSAWAFETGPYGEGHLIWQSVEPCAPCLEAAPCSRDAACATSFADKAVLSRLAQLAQLKGETLSSGPALPLPLENICLLDTHLDDFGQDLRPLAGELPERDARLAHRELLRSHGLRTAPRRVRLEQAAAKALYHETDWMIDMP